MENLGIDPKLLIAQLVNFAIFFIVFKLYVAKPFAAFLNKQRKDEEAREEMMRDIEHKHEKVVAEEKKWREKLQKDRDQILADTKKAAEQIRQEIIKVAEEEAEEIVSKSKKQTEEERQELYREVKTKSIDLSLFIIQKALKDYLNEDMRKNLTAYILKNVKENQVTYEQ